MVFIGVLYNELFHLMKYQSGTNKPFQNGALPSLNSRITNWPAQEKAATGVVPLAS